MVVRTIRISAGSFCRLFRGSLLSAGIETSTSDIAIPTFTNFLQLWKMIKYRYWSILLPMTTFCTTLLNDYHAGRREEATYLHVHPVPERGLMEGRVGLYLKIGHSEV